MNYFQFADQPGTNSTLEDAVSNIVCQVIERLDEGPHDRDGFQELISESEGDETAAIGLSFEERLEFIEEGVDELGWGELTFNLENLRFEIESHAVMFIHLLAESRAYQIFEELYDFMDEHDLEPEQMRGASNFGWLAHRAERDEGSHCTVYEYRHVEEVGNHIDVWEYRLPSGERVWFEQRLSDEA